VPLRHSRASVATRILRKLSAWALPRPSARDSAKFANNTVNQSHNTTCTLNAEKCQYRFTVVTIEPRYTIKITRFFRCWRGWSLDKLSSAAWAMSAVEKPLVVFVFGAIKVSLDHSELP